jgi:hypothetical protein
LDIYVAKYEEATRAWTQTRSFKGMTDSLARAMERGMWEDMVEHLTRAYDALEEAYPAPGGTWLGTTADWPEIESLLAAFRDRLQRVGEQVEALHSLVFEEQRREAIGVLARDRIPSRGL